MRNSRLKRCSIQASGGTPLFGFMLASQGQVFEFFTVTAFDLNEWIYALSKHVIYLDLKEDFKMFEQIGTGQSSKVHKCERKQQPGHFLAVKSIKKTHIMKTK